MHHSKPVMGEYTYREEPVTKDQKRVWKIKAIIWMIPTGIIVIGSIVFAIVFSVIDSKLNTGLPFLVMPAFAGVPLAFALPYLRQGFTRKPQVTQVYEYEGNYVRKAVARVKVKCPKCEAENQFGSEKCKECGEPIPLRCPHCGADIIPNDEACRDCGLVLQ
ncbi:MAG: zinc ribbon domain-containing protein [Clostridiales bacterium]|nr:zinc ribbon domain-containing protein [Clostridiales bacterium]